MRNDWSTVADKCGYREVGRSYLIRAGFLLVISTLIASLAGIALSGSIDATASAAVYGYGNTIAVPAQYGTIQSAINAAYNGDTILVSDGTYSENLNFKGKAVTVRSENGSAVTIVRGSGANSPVLTFATGETSAAVLDGFTIDNQASANTATRGISISNGAAPTIRNSVIKGNALSTGQTGAGIFISGGGASIENSTIGTAADPNTGGGFGGGIYATGSGAALVITDSSISYNQTPNGGAGIYLTSKSAVTTITNTLISNNYSPQTGGGIFSNGSPLYILDSTISNNTVNNTGLNGGGLYLAGAAATATVGNTSFSGNRTNGGGGGAIYVTLDADLTFIDSHLAGNVAAATSGGAVFVNGAGSTANINKAYIRGNDAGQYGGGIYAAGGGTATLTNCMITGNTADGFTYSDGGAMYNNGSVINVINSTIAGNFARRYGGASFGNASTIANSIVWGNSAGTAGQQIYGSPAVKYTDVQDGFTGTGNINTYPLFVDFQQASLNNPTTAGNFHLQAASPILNAASDQYAPEDDIDGTIRPQGPGDDMGADEIEYGNAGVAAPTMGTPVPAESSICWNFTDNASNEAGFRLHDDTEAVKAQYAAPDRSYLDESGLTPNTFYTRHVHAYNAESESEASAASSAYTLAVAPNVNADRQLSVWSAAANLTFTNAAAFGYGGVEYYRYSFDQNPTHVFLGTEPQWSAGELSRTATADGSWYLHVKSYNAANVPGGSLDLGPFLYDGSAPAVTGFSATAPDSGTDIAITVFNASDNAAVTGYMITSSASQPAAGDGGWDGAAPSVYHVSAPGTYSLYPWTRDAAGNVSPLYGSPATIVVPTGGGTDPHTLMVPSQHWTIQSAINAASAGDTVLVDDGTYPENINFIGKAITVISVNGPQSAVIQGYGIANPVVTIGRGEGSSSTLSGFTIDNKAENVVGAGAGISVYGNSSPTLSNLIVTGNSTSGTGRGGGISVQGAASSPRFDSCTITDNRGGASGGGLDLNGSGAVTLVNSNITNNRATNTLLGNGGGIAVSGAAAGLVIDGGSVSDNNAIGNGGGIYVDDGGGQISITGAQLSHNTVTNWNGGALYIKNHTTRVVISGSSFTDNLAPVNGGAVYYYNNAALGVYGSTFSGNSQTSSTGQGGAMFVSTSTAELIDSLLTGNRANGYGGGLYVEKARSSKYLRAVNTTFSGNQASTHEGGAVYAINTFADFVNDTFSGNDGLLGGAMYLNGDTSATLRNSILWGDNARNSASEEVSLINGAAAAAVYSDVDQEGYAGSHGNLRIDPAFVSPLPASQAPSDAGDLHLRNDSPVIDAANDQYAPAADIDGDSRPQGSGFDMGSDEVRVCAACQPALSLALGSSYWASYNDYLARRLSVDFNISNSGHDARQVTMKGATATNGATCVTAPFELGDISSGGSKRMTLQYSVPPGTTMFRTVVYVSTKDDCDNTYQYPGPFPEGT